MRIHGAGSGDIQGGAAPRADSGPPAVVARLEASGLRRPVASFSDPRLRYPNLLLTDGGERTAADDAVLWQRSAGECSQTLRCGETGWESIRSDTGGQVHVLERFPDGRTRSGLSPQEKSPP